MEQFANSAQTFLASSMLSTDLTLTVNSGVGFPATGTFRIVVEQELIIVGAVSGAVFSSLTRGAEGTTAVGHSGGVTVTAVVTAGTFAQFKSDILGEVAGMIAGR
jgi:hypothetical protein